MYFWKFVTLFGDKYFYLVMASLVYFLYDRRLGKKIVHLLLISASVLYSLKLIVKEPRPTGCKIPCEGYSFPSGHTGATTTFWTYLSLKIRNLFLWVFSFVLIILVSYSRLDLNVHYPIDILGGITVGLLVVYFFVWIEKTIKMSEEDKKKLELVIYTVLFVLSAMYTEKIPIEGLALIGFGFGISLFEYFYKLSLDSDLKKFSSFVSSFALLLPVPFVTPIASLLLGFLSGFLPLSFWYDIENIVKHKRK